jgi:CheY-like chemotaxis protein
LLNLAVNARDAMPSGGRLQISARSSPPPDPQRSGRAPSETEWVLLEVRDGGVGMSAEVLERVFEPFFTTKEVGKGSGLGLSQVYGFVRQSGGHVEAESAPGEGTVFRLFLPRSTQAAEPRPASKARNPKSGRFERVLVVEDDAEVLALTVDMLTELKYRVLTATNAPAALSLLEREEPVDLMFSDVVMPGGLSGVELARHAREMRPDLKVLLTSGYVGELRNELTGEFPLLEKPYERSVLASRLRELCDEARAKQLDDAKRAAGAVADPASA